MADRLELENVVRDERLRRGWSQDELARRAGLSRTGVSAIETSRLVPSAAAALALAAALDRRVEDLFSLPDGSPGRGAGAPEWAWAPGHSPMRFWRASVGGRIRVYPVEASPMGVVPHDGVSLDGAVPPDSAVADASSRATDPRTTLVIACCDPAVGLLAAELADSAGIRLIVLPRSSRAALDLLGQGLVHAAGVHLATTGNAAAVRQVLGSGYSLLSGAEWEEGVALADPGRIKTLREAAKQPLRWVGREHGSGARQCLDELLGDRRSPPRRLARDHRAVAEAVRAGWADAGVCLRLASDDAGLTFLSVRREAYDLCIPDSSRDDPRIKALLNALRSPSYRQRLGELPGYNSARTGELQRVV